MLKIQLQKKATMRGVQKASKQCIFSINKNKHNVQISFGCKNLITVVVLIIMLLFLPTIKLSLCPIG